jgi:hypothetical protein
MSDKIESYLFIGGCMDGEWVNVPESARRWNVLVLGFIPLGYHKDVPEDFGFNERYDQEYYKFRLIDRGPDKVIYVFVCKTNPTSNYTDMQWDIMCKLVNNYKVIK